MPVAADDTCVFETTAGLLTVWNGKLERGFVAGKVLHCEHLHGAGIGHFQELAATGSVAGFTMFGRGETPYETAPSKIVAEYANGELFLPMFSLVTSAPPGPACRWYLNLPEPTPAQAAKYAEIKTMQERIGWR
jgi:hypothetical protein